MEILETIAGWIEVLENWLEPIKKIFGFLKSIVSWAVSFLPHSPFTAFLDAMESLPYLNYLNWFIPVSTFIAIGEAWLVAIGIFYSWSIVLRWIKAVG